MENEYIFRDLDKLLVALKVSPGDFLNLEGIDLNKQQEKNELLEILKSILIIRSLEEIKLVHRIKLISLIHMIKNKRA